MKISDKNAQLFYGDAYEALERAIASSGKTKKEIAAACYPGRTPETAKSLLSRALNPENSDVHLCICTMLTIMRETRPDDFLYYLCDEFGFNRPDRKAPEDLEREVAAGMAEIKDMMQELMTKVNGLGRARG